MVAEHPTDKKRQYQSQLRITLSDFKNKLPLGVCKAVVSALWLYQLRAIKVGSGDSIYQQR